ncbi:hypothetical protein [Flavobacterium hungaricum]|jgi:hypothetical protein|nr:hypothetical protein [Flavobacterium hungaricum]
MLEKILRGKDTIKLTKAEQKNIVGGDYPEFNCDKAVTDKYYAC